MVGRRVSREKGTDTNDLPAFEAKKSPAVAGLADKMI
jgi:hypothetical protein